MKNSHALACQILGRFWLEEVRLSDLSLVQSLPELADSLPDGGEAQLLELAVEFQRLFGFNLPPYESLFVDPSGMLNAPATARVQAVYSRAGWGPSPGARVGAPDHLGLEMLALGELHGNQFSPALLCDHLALWAPVYFLTLERLEPHPFYAALGSLSLEVLLSMLEEQPAIGLAAKAPDPFPSLPPAPVYRASFQGYPTASTISEEDIESISHLPALRTEDNGGEADFQELSLKKLVRRLLVPCQAGLYLTRQDIAAIGLALDLPGGMGERVHMLTTLFQLAGQYELLPSLFEQLDNLLQQSDRSYQALTESHPAWHRYGSAWRQRLVETQNFLGQSLAIE